MESPVLACLPVWCFSWSFHEDYRIFCHRAHCLTGSGLCLAPAVQTCWLIIGECYTQMLREKGFVQRFPGITPKSIIVKNKVRTLRFSTGTLGVFWCTKWFGFKAAAEDTGGKKVLVLSSVGQDKISVEHQHCWGAFRQTSKQNPQRSATYLPSTDSYTSVAFFLILTFFPGKTVRQRASRGRGTFTAPTHEPRAQ